MRLMILTLYLNLHSNPVINIRKEISLVFSNILKISRQVFCNNDLNPLLNPKTTLVKLGSQNDFDSGFLSDEPTSQQKNRSN